MASKSISASLKRFAGIVHLPAVSRIRDQARILPLARQPVNSAHSNGQLKFPATFQGRTKFPLISDDSVYMLSRNIKDSISLLTPLHLGALISINVMNFALICKDRTAISLNLCKIQEFPRLES